MFALDCQNYARWPSVHYRDMCVLPIKHPHVYAEFCNCSFVVHKTKRLFLSIALHPAHEKLNAVVKGERGAVSMNENPATLSIARNPGQNGGQACALHATMTPEQHKKSMGKYNFSIITMS